MFRSPSGSRFDLGTRAEIDPDETERTRRTWDRQAIGHFLRDPLDGLEARGFAIEMFDRRVFGFVERPLGRKA